MSSGSLRITDENAREFVFLIERVRSLAIRLPALMPVLERLLELLDHASSTTIEESRAFFEFCRTHPQLALILATSAGVLDNALPHTATNEWGDEPTLPGGQPQVDKPR